MEPPRATETKEHVTPSGYSVMRNEDTGLDGQPSLEDSLRIGGQRGSE